MHIGLSFEYLLYLPITLNSAPPPTYGRATSLFPQSFFHRLRYVHPTVCYSHYILTLYLQLPLTRVCYQVQSSIQSFFHRLSSRSPASAIRDRATSRGIDFTTRPLLMRHARRCRILRTDYLDTLFKLGLRRSLRMSLSVNPDTTDVSTITHWVPRPSHARARKVVVNILTEPRKPRARFGLEDGRIRLL